MKIDKKALEEATLDTFIGLPINFCLSWFIAYVVLSLGIYNALIISLCQVVVLTIFAIIRKYIIRIKYKKGEKNVRRKSKRNSKTA